MRNTFIVLLFAVATACLGYGYAPGNYLFFRFHENGQIFPQWLESAMVVVGTDKSPESRQLAALPDTQGALLDINNDPLHFLREPIADGLLFEDTQAPFFLIEQD